MNMRKPLYLAVVTILAGVSSVAAAGPLNIEVKPWVYDPAHTDLVNSKWVAGAGCPLNANVATYPATEPTGTYTDTTCTTGDAKDKENAGLLLVKSGPTSNNAAGGASVDHVNGIVLTDVGYDIKIGSHCGAGAPRFNIETTTGKFFFLGCSSPPATTSVTGPGSNWTRKRWGNGTAGSVFAFNATSFAFEAIADPIKSIDIVFDEGDDQGSGYAILDNIDVNGVMEGE